MISGKERSYLKGLANTLKPVLQIGKEGLTEAFITQYEETIASKELVKINILESSMLDAKEVASELCEITGSEFVSALGRKAVLYKRPNLKKGEKPKIVLPK